MPPAVIRDGEWSSGLCDCCGAPGGCSTCCVACFCPCVLYGYLAGAALLCIPKSASRVCKLRCFAAKMTPQEVVCGSDCCASCCYFYSLHLFGVVNS